MRLWAAAFAGMLALPLAAQVETARIRGTVRDASGAVVPDAAVRITHVETNTVQETRTREDGRYESSPLRTGVYRVAVEREGFQRTVREGVRLEIQETAEVDMALTLGAVQQEVSVRGDAPLLTTSEAAQSQVIDNQKIVDLPLNGRNYIQLALLSAGASETAKGARVGGFSAGGMRASMNNYLLDGMDNNSRQLAGDARQAETIRPSVDAIQEFRVMTNSYSAEYGRAAGGVVNVAIKSGTNQVHGAVFHFLRNEAFDAKNFFDNPDEDKPPFKRNQSGFAAGGPLRRDRTFLFGDWEGTRIRESRSVNSTVPLATMVRGDFTSLQPDRIYDPASLNAAGERTPFAGNLVPVSRFDPVGGRVLGWFPEPNRPGVVNNYFANPPSDQDVDRWDAKLDHVFSPKDTVFGRYSSQAIAAPVSPSLPPPAFGGGATGAAFQHTGQNFVASWTRILTPNVFVAAKGGWNRILTDRFVPMKENLNRELGIRGVNQTIPGSALFNINGYTSLGPGAFAMDLSDSQTRQITGDLTWVRRRHNVKMGLQFSWLQNYETSSSASHGGFTFDGSYTRHPRTLREGNSIADLLLGTVTSGLLSNSNYMNQRAPWYDVYIQDEWRVSERLTLNIGLRYELHLPYVETRNLWANFDIDSQPGRAALVPAGGGSRYERALIRTDANNFGPRFGFAYRAGQKTVARGGYGVFYAGFQPFGDSQYLHINPPFHVQVGLVTDRVRPSILLRTGLPEDALEPRNARDVQTSSYERGGRLTYAQQWNFAIQRQVAPNMLLEAGYYANVARKIMQRTDGNPAVPGPGNVNQRRPIRSVEVPGAGAAVTLGASHRQQWSANANFHSMQARLERRLSGGLSVLGSYIWAKTIGDSRGVQSDGGSSGTTPQNPRNLRAERSLADEHIPHRLVVSEVWEVPVGRGRRILPDLPRLWNGLLGGWSLAGIATIASGGVVNLSVRGNPSNTNDPNRPDVRKDWRLGREERTLDRWFDRSAFEANAPYQFGNAARNLIQGPGTSHFDLAAYKEFRPRETVRLQFRAEAFNAFNTPEFGDPETQLGNPGFGVIRQAGRPRNLQFGLKVIF